MIISEIYAVPNTIATVDTGSVDDMGAPIFEIWQNERVEIYNTTGATIDISGWYLRDEDGFTEPLPAGATLEPGEAAVIFGTDSLNTAADPDFLLEFPTAVAAQEAFYDAWQCGYKVFAVRGWRNGDFDVLGADSNSLGGLSNTPNPANETLRLYKDDGSLVDVANYLDSDGAFEGTAWPNDPTGLPDGPNFSIFVAGSALDATSNNEGGNWLPAIIDLPSQSEVRNNLVTEFFTIDDSIVSTLMEASPGIVPGGTPLDLDDCPTFSCNIADLAEPFGVLDLDDADAFIGAFLAGDSAADLVAPIGVIDLDDVDAFIAAFLAGCP